ncbi:hypothetical protein ACFL27_02995 [candidate division CSSED10-310 bacterium]|uniref:DUF3108 domain-containing protein n=1 Tax=candidate division CSSED10-310 bacterium TaxID=2855610 RepID=A0ABV6YSH5_UNCC1
MIVFILMLNQIVVLHAEELTKELAKGNELIIMLAPMHKNLTTFYYKISDSGWENGWAKNTYKKIVHNKRTMYENRSYVMMKMPNQITFKTKIKDVFTSDLRPVEIKAKNIVTTFDGTTMITTRVVTFGKKKATLIRRINQEEPKKYEIDLPNQPFIHDVELFLLNSPIRKYDSFALHVVDFGDEKNIITLNHFKVLKKQDDSLWVNISPHGKPLSTYYILNKENKLVKIRYIDKGFNPSFKPTTSEYFEKLKKSFQTAKIE